MQSSSGFDAGVSQPGSGPSGSIGSAPPQGHAKTLEQVAPGFTLDTVCCSVETRLRERIVKDDDLQTRINALGEEREQARIHTRLSLLTDGYRVDEAITPKLFRLGQLLTRVLRLPHPLDMFVWPSEEKNAFCLPSRKGNRLIMCLHSGLVGTLSSQELLFVMGHEVGHAHLRHGQGLGVTFDHPGFSPIEVVRLRALDRAQEVSCDRFGLLACQDVRVASTALFKVASGLNERWITFDEKAYARHFDELSSMAEVIDLEDASRSHPLDPLRVKALVAFSQSETYARAFGKTGWRLSSGELEQGVETMLSVLDPDVTALENAKEEQAFGRFVIDGALLIIAADGVVDPGEVAWLRSATEGEWSGEGLAQDLAKPEIREQIQRRLEANAHVLRNKLPERNRAALLRLMCDVALSAGGIPDEEFEVLDHLRQLLNVRAEFARSVLHEAQEEHAGPGGAGQGGDDEPQTSGGRPAAESAPPADPLETILERAKLTEVALAHARQVCQQIRSQGTDPILAVRNLVAWAVTASRRKGPLTQAQAKRLAASAIRFCREVQESSGAARRSRGTPLDRQIQDVGVVALFQRGELVGLGPERKPVIVLSVSRAKNLLVVAPQDNLDSAQQVEPCDLVKDPAGGIWPEELSG